MWRKKTVCTCKILHPSIAWEIYDNRHVTSSVTSFRNQMNTKPTHAGLHSWRVQTATPLSVQTSMFFFFMKTLLQCISLWFSKWRKTSKILDFINTCTRTTAVYFVDLATLYTCTQTAKTQLPPKVLNKIHMYNAELLTLTMQQQKACKTGACCNVAHIM